jgi:hypothetical protein
MAGVESAALQLEAVAARGSLLISLGLTSASSTDTSRAELEALRAELAEAQAGLERTEEIARQLLTDSPDRDPER